MTAEKMYIFLQLIVFRYWQGFKKGPLNNIALLKFNGSKHTSTKGTKNASNYKENPRKKVERKASGPI